MSLTGYAILVSSQKAHTFLNLFAGGEHAASMNYKIAISVIFTFCLLLNQPIAYADGGAPNLVYVAGGGPGISVIDVAQQRIARTLHLDSAPAMTQLSSDGSTLFIAQPEQNRALVLNASTGKIRCQVHVPGQPSLLILSTQEDAFFVAGNGDSHVRAFDPNTCKLLRTIAVSGPIYGLTTALDGGVFPTHTGLYQLCIATANQVLIFDPDGQQLASYPIAAGPRHISAPPADFKIYVTTQQGSLVVIDLNKNQVTAPLLHGMFGSMDFDETTHEVYVPDVQHRRVDVVAYKSDAERAIAQSTSAGLSSRRSPGGGGNYQRRSTRLCCLAEWTDHHARPPWSATYAELYDWWQSSLSNYRRLSSTSPCVH